MGEGSSELLPGVGTEKKADVEMVFSGSQEVLEHLANKEENPDRKIALVITGGGPKVSVPFGILKGLLPHSVLF